MNDLILALLAGVAGAGLGALLGLAYDRARRWRGRSPVIGAVVLAAVLAAWTALVPRAPAQAVEARMDDASAAALAVHRYYPATFAQLAADASSKDPQDQAALQEHFRARYAALIGAHRNQMNDATAEALGKLMLEETRELRLTSPQACVAILHGGPVDAEVARSLPPELLRHASEVTARMVEQIATDPARPADKLGEPEAQALTGQALRALDADDRRVVAPFLGQRIQPQGREQARAFCAFFRAYYEAALNAPGGTIRRVLTN